MRCVPPQLLLGWSFHRGALRALRRGAANMDVLVSLGTSAAYLYSVTSVIVHKVQWDRGTDAPADDYFETSALLITFISCGWSRLSGLANGGSSGR